MFPTLKRSLKTRSKHLCGLRSRSAAAKFGLLARQFQTDSRYRMRGSVSGASRASSKGFWAIDSREAALAHGCKRTCLNLSGSHPQVGHSNNGSPRGDDEVEAEFLYCFIRAQRPKRIVQIGCGVSTAVCLLAARDEGYSPRIICIEPYPPCLRTRRPSWPHRTSQKRPGYRLRMRL